MSRLGLFARIGLIVAAALFAIQLVAILAYFAVQRIPPDEAQPRLALRLAALVQLLDQIPPAARPLALTATAGNGWTASIVPQPPAGLSEREGLVRLLRTTIDLHLRQFGTNGRSVQIMQDDEGQGDAAKGLLIYIELASGEYLAVRANDRVTIRVLGAPVGFLSGLLGILVAGAALLAVARETKPLSLLARELDKLGTRSRPILIPERGATEVRTLIRAVNAMQERIAALIGNRTLVLGALSHDLRTHLTRLRLRIELLPAGKERERAIADVEGMLALFEDTLDFAQMSFGESGAGTDLGELLERRVVERGDGGAIHLHDMETLPRLAVNDTAMARLVDNLIENALRYGGEASLSASHDDGWVVLRVEDRGPGIPPEERDRVFEPFVRLDPSRNRESGGTGLGLTIVKQVVDTHGGQITLADREGGGLSVTVRLPVLAAH